MSKLYTESFWWFLAMPLCALRALENIRTDGVDVDCADVDDSLKEGQLNGGRGLV